MKKHLVVIILVIFNFIGLVACQTTTILTTTTSQVFLSTDITIQKSIQKVDAYSDLTTLFLF